MALNKTHSTLLRYYNSQRFLNFAGPAISINYVINDYCEKQIQKVKKQKKNWFDSLFDVCKRTIRSETDEQNFNLLSIKISSGK